MAISITPSPFGSVTVTLDGELGGVLSVSVLATSNSALDMALGVPGPAGATGAQGPAGTNGTNGTNGVGVPVGGSAGQVLAKINSTNYNTEWITPSAGGGTWGSITGTLSNQTDLYSALNNKLSLSGGTMSGTIYLPSLRNLLNTNLTVTAYNDTGAGTNFIHTFDAYNGTFSLATNGGGLVFPDATTQTTAGLPLTGGMVTGLIQVDFGTGSYATIGAEEGFFAAGPNGFILLNQSGLQIAGPGNGITFPDFSVQTTAFPPDGGTTLQYIDGTGALQTLPAIPSIAGLLTSANNLSELTATASTARTNLGLGTMSTEPASAYLSTASAVANYQTLAGMSAYLSTSAAVSTYQTLAGMSDYLSTSAAASTYQTLAGMSAYLSTSAASATYLTQSNASSTYLTQANAATTYIGTSAYATTAQAQAGTSTTTVINPSTLLDAKFFQGGKSLNVNTYSSLSSGTGVVVGTIGMNAQQVASPTTAVGYGARYGQLMNSSRGLSYTGALDFSKRVVIGGRFQKNTATTDSNAVFRFYCGKTNTVGDMTSADKGIGFRVAGSGALQLVVSNGSALTTTTSSFTPVINQCYDVVITSDGSGNATLYVNGSSVATSTGASTTSSGNNYFGIEAQNLATISTPVSYYIVTDMFCQVNL